MKIETVFQVIAVVLAGAAAYFLYTDHRDGAFVAAVVGLLRFPAEPKIPGKGPKQDPRRRAPSRK